MSTEHLKARARFQKDIDRVQRIMEDLGIYEDQGIEDEQTQYVRRRHSFEQFDREIMDVII